jgi:hypothetical protein
MVDAGLRAILLCLLIELVLLGVATVVGIVVWMGHGFATGLVSGMAAFVVGQTIAILIMDMAFHFPDRSEFDPPLPLENEVLDALRNELESKRHPDAEAIRQERRSSG